MKKVQAMTLTLRRLLPPDSIPAQETGVKRKSKRERRKEAGVRGVSKRQFPGQWAPTHRELVTTRPGEVSIWLSTSEEVRQSYLDLDTGPSVGPVVVGSPSSSCV